VLALMGDTIDNIKGVRGVGEKTAVKLIGQYGSVERLYENLTLIPGKLRETLAAGRKDALLSRELALLNREVQVALDLDAFRRVEPDWAKLRQLWMEMEFTRLVKELPPPAPQAPPEPAQRLEGKAAIAAWLGPVPAGAPLALDWAGEPTPPEPHIAGLAVFHPAAGPAELSADEPPASFGGRELIVHDAKPLIEHWLARGLTPPAIHDSAVAAYLLNSARLTYKLEQVCLDALNEYPPEADPSRAFGVRAEFAWRYWEHAAAELRARELWSIYEEIERPLVPVLALMERHGIRVDPARLEAFAKELERDLDNLTREIYQLAGEEFTIASPKQLAQILFEKLKLPPIRKTKTGYSTDADVLTELALGHPLPAKILEHRSLAKLKGTYADTLPGLINPRTGRIHTTFNQLVAATGRLSSQDPNLMNIPIRTELGRRIRQAFIPEDGWRFVAADYSQIELRILAHLSEEPALIESFGRGEDIHTRTASEVFRVAPGSVTSLQRTIAKSANYAILYGVSAFGLSQATKIDQKEAQRYISDYFASHPRVRAFIDRTLAEGRERGHVSTLLGRRRYLPDLASGNPVARNAAERMAMNAPVQGTASDMIKIAMVRAQAALTARGLRARMLLQVHDELLFEAPPDEVPAVEALAREIMAAALPLKVPVVVDVKTGTDWAEV
jgi:DNA polymerase I